MRGTVKFYNEQKGYGFIQPEGGGKDIFVHATALEKSGVSSIKEGDKVEYESGEDKRNGKLNVVSLKIV